MVFGIPCLENTDFIAKMTDADVVEVSLADDFWVTEEIVNKE